MTISTFTAMLQPLMQLNGQPVKDVRNITRVRARYQLVAKKRFDADTFQEVLQYRPEPRVSFKSFQMPAPSTVINLPYAGFFEWRATTPYDDHIGRATLLVNQVFDPDSFYTVTYWYFPTDNQFDYFQSRLEHAGALNTYGGVGKPIHQSRYSFPAGLTGQVDIGPYRLAAA